MADQAIHSSFTSERAVASCAVCQDACGSLDVGGCELRRRVLEALWAMLATDSGEGYLHIQIGTEQKLVSCADKRAFINTVAGAALLRERVRVGMAPRASLDDPELLEARVVWARLENGKAAQALARFRPAPTLVLREGDTVKRLAIWWLAKPLTRGWLLRANERLSRALGGIRDEADPAYTFVPPFAELTPRKAVVVERIQPVFYGAGQVVGEDRPDRRALPDAPERDAWRKEAAKAA